MTTPFVSRSLAVLVVAGSLAFASMSAAQTPKMTETAQKAAADSKPWTGDFDGMLARRNIRLLVPYSRTLFFVENGKELGITAGLARDFENYLNQKHAKALAGKKIKLVLVPTTRDQLLSGLTAGTGDIAGGNLTATATRLQTADFVSPIPRNADEVLVSGPTAPAVA